MASVFLSYDRSDSRRAKRIARDLEKAGHSVWWDGRIKSGAQYNREIDLALQRADAVVVLWSKCSIDSTWVRDEAATGRDAGKLVPVRIDDVEPPLGFRQFQTTDLGSWSGRSRSAEFGRLLDALDAWSEGDADRAAAATRKRWQAPPLKAFGVAMVVIIGLVLLARNLSGPSASAPVVAVIAADPSPTSKSLARDFFVKLGTLQASRPSSIALVDGEHSSKTAALIFQVGGSGKGEGSEANLVLLSGKGRELLWAKALRDPNGNEADLRQQVAYVGAHLLGCAIDGLGQVIKLGRLGMKTYLDACASEGGPEGGAAAMIAPLRQLVQDAPDFAGGWARLLSAEVAALDDPMRRDEATMRSGLARDIAEARKRHPDLPEAYVAELALTSEREFLKRSALLDRAIERNPDSPALRSTRALFRVSIGRIDDAVEDGARAVDLDPLSPAVRDSYIASLAVAGRLEEARGELDAAERLWPGASSVVDARFRLNLRQGDPREALRLLHAGVLRGTPAHWVRLNESLLQARIYRTPQNIANAIEAAETAFEREPRAIFGLSQTLVEFGREEELFQLLLNWKRMDIVEEITGAIFRPGFAKFHEDPRFMQVTKRIGLLHFWQKTGKWPDFCSRPNLPYDCRKKATELTS